MRKVKSTKLKRQLRTKRNSNGSQSTVISPGRFIVGGIRNPTMMQFNAESLNAGLQDASLFKGMVVKNKLDNMKAPGATMSLPVYNAESALSLQQQIQNIVALDVLSSLGVVFIETPTSLLDEMNKDEDAGLIR